MSTKGLLITLLASGLAEAVAQDEKPEVGGFDLSAGMFGPAVSEWLRSTAATIDEAQTGAKPIDMVLHCPQCHKQHIDAPSPNCRHDACPRQEFCGAGTCQEPWPNDPHRSHLCHGCGHIWRPADVATNGVEAVKTKGKNDSPIVHPTPPEEIHETFDTATEAGRWQAESASYALEAVFQIVPDVKPRDDDAVLMSMSQVENLMRHFGWVPPSEGRKPAGVVSQEPYRKLPVVPDFDAVKNKRMSELTPTQQDDARELWLRNSWQTFLYTGEHIEFLLRRLDDTRGVKP